MRYQPALVLGTLAAGAAASSSNLRHADFHKRSEEKRDVNWNAIAYDLSGVDWSTVKFGNPSPTPAPVAPSPAQPKVVATSAAAPSPAAEVSTSNTNSGHLGGSEIVSDILNGIQGFAGKLGAKLGTNSKASNGQIWIGGDSKYSVTFKNSATSDAMVWCWGKSTMWINAEIPLISVKLAPGQSQKFSIAEGFSGGCGPSFDDSDLFMGLLNESILEFTTGAGANGCFDISREINMKGIKMSAKGSKCTSGMNGGQQSCTFVCTDPSATRCGAGGGDYAIDIGNGKKGPCMVGKDPYTGDASGGCQMGDDGEHMEVEIMGSRW